MCRGLLKGPLRKVSKFRRSFWFEIILTDLAQFTLAAACNNQTM